jgi:hypothetical protein
MLGQAGHGIVVLGRVEGPVAVEGATRSAAGSARAAGWPTVVAQILSSQ